MIRLATYLAGLAFVLGLSGCPSDNPCETDPTAASCPSDYVPTQALLAMQPIAQQTEVWCWAASAEMILRHYGLPNLNPFANYQCGIVGAYAYILGGPTHPCVSNCGLCVSGISSLTELQRVIDNYGDIARLAGLPSRDLSSKIFFAPLNLQQLAKELDAGRPILAGISFHGLRLPNISTHAVVIVGYDALTQPASIYVNDPFPYEFYFQQQNPYFASGGILVQPGRYRIALQSFTSELVWGNTIYDIR